MSRRQPTHLCLSRAIKACLDRQLFMGNSSVDHRCGICQLREFTRKMALSSVYNLLHRHGWRKLAPDKRHPQSDPVAQEAWKKNSPKR